MDDGEAMFRDKLTILNIGIERSRGGGRSTSLSAMALCSLLAGCQTLESGYAPRSAFDLDKDISALHAEFDSKSSIAAYYAAGPETIERRNAFVAGRLTLYNLEYIRFISKFELSQAQERSAFDMAALGLGLGTTIVEGSRAKTVLGAVATAFTGARTSVEKNFYNDETAAALVSQMNAQRKAALVPILAGLKQPSIGDYPMTTAIVDLSAYQMAGTVDGALQGIQADAGVKDQVASAKIEQLRTVTFKPDDSTTRIIKWIYPGWAMFDADGTARDGSGKTLQPVQANVAALRKYLADNGLEGLALGSFFNSGDLAASRTSALSKLNIP